MLPTKIRHRNLTFLEFSSIHKKINKNYETIKQNKKCTICSGNIQSVSSPHSDPITYLTPHFFRNASHPCFPLTFSLSSLHLPSFPQFGLFQLFNISQACNHETSREGPQQKNWFQFWKEPPAIHGQFFWCNDLDTKFLVYFV